MWILWFPVVVGMLIYMGFIVLGMIGDGKFSIISMGFSLFVALFPITGTLLLYRTTKNYIAKSKVLRKSQGA
jgi:hypothetical protein